MKNAFRFGAVLGAIVLALVLAGHGPASAGQAPQADADLVAGDACTSILVGRDASTDGSTMTTHTCDCGTCDWTWRHVPAADHKPGSTRKIYHVSQYKTWPPAEGLKWDIYKKDFAGLEIPEVAHTYAYHHGMFGYMNENQVAISAPRMICPSPPMLMTLARKAMQMPMATSSSSMVVRGEPSRTGAMATLSSSSTRRSISARVTWCCAASMPP